MYKRDNLHRGSVVPYIVDKGVKYFLLGIDSRTGDITDLGGGVWREETVLDGAFREFHEESLDIFKNIVKKETHSIAVSRDNLNTFFVPLHTDVNTLVDICNRFNSMKKTDAEINKLFFVSETNFLNVIKNSKEANCRKTRMWNLLKIFYNDIYNDNVSKELYSLYLSTRPRKIMICGA